MAKRDSEVFISIGITVINDGDRNGLGAFTRSKVQCANRNCVVTTRRSNAVHEIAVSQAGGVTSSVINRCGTGRVRAFYRDISAPAILEDIKDWRTQLQVTYRSGRGCWRRSWRRSWSRRRRWVRSIAPRQVSSPCSEMLVVALWVNACYIVTYRILLETKYRVVDVIAPVCVSLISSYAVGPPVSLSLIHISEPTRLLSI